MVPGDKNKVTVQSATAAMDSALVIANQNTRQYDSQSLHFPCSLTGQRGERAWEITRISNSIANYYETFIFLSFIFILVFFQSAEFSLAEYRRKPEQPKGYSRVAWIDTVKVSYEIANLSKIIR